MKYEPIKASLGKIFNRHPFLRILFYRLLHILLLRSWHIRKHLKQIVPLIDKDAHILDAGAGFGQYTYYLSRFSDQWSIKAVDINPIQVKESNRFFNSINLSHRVKFEVADLTHFSEENTYQLIISVDVMEHIEEDTRVFQNLYNSLKKGGFLLISTPSDKGGSDAHSHEDVSFIEEHVRNGYSIEDITSKLQKAGFTKITCKYQYGIPGSLAWHLSMKYPIILLNISKIFFIILPFYYGLLMPICLLLNFLDVRISHTSGTGLIVIAKKD